jgi:hypothetical protein
MLVNTETREVTTLGVVETNTFSIKANGKAFKVLIDGLYSNKILAVIRELWSNAYDSHAEAGAPERPFDCQLPTVWDPYFRVRDYGVSLSHDDVMSLYTTVFESTKEDTNAQVGKLGLGSKSPFAYTDTFTVTAWRDGEKRTYSAYIGEDYVPRIALLGRETSDEPQGLEVSFPVQISDCDKFKREAERVMLGFDVRPTIVGDVELRDVHKSVLVEGDGWKLYESTDWREGASARQGCVIYPIDPDAVNGATSTQRGLLKAPFFIEFPIGALEIAASREGLGYDKTTCENIVAKLAQIETEVIAHFSKEIADLTTRWDVAKRFAELKQLNLPEAVISCLEKMTWRGQKLQTKFQINNRSGSGYTANKVDDHVMQGGRSRHGPGWTGSTSGYFISPADTTIYYCDPDANVKRVRERIKHHYRGHVHSGNIIVVRAPKGSMFLKRFLVQAGRPQMINVAELPEPPKDVLPSRKKTQIKALTRSSWFDKEVDPSQGGVYVSLERADILGPNGGHAGLLTVTKIMTALSGLGLMDGTLYGIPRSCKSVEKMPGWRSLWEVAREAMQRYDGRDHGRYKAIDAALNDQRTDACCQMVEHWIVDKMRPVHAGEAQRLYDLVASLLAEFQSLETPLYQIANHWPVNGEFVPVEQSLSLAKEFAAFADTYPVCRHFGRGHCTADDAAYLLQYVNLADGTSAAAPLSEVA